MNTTPSAERPELAAIRRKMFVGGHGRAMIDACMETKSVCVAS